MPGDRSPSAGASTARPSCAAARHAHRDRAGDARAAPRRRRRRGSGDPEVVALGVRRFPRDEFTTLPETRDRLLATSLTATWHYQPTIDVDFGPPGSAVRQTLLEAFAEHDSQSVQHTLYAMGQAVLDTSDEVSDDPPGDAEQAPSAGRPVARSAWRIATRSSSPPKSRTA